ncbi:MAG: YciI family protein [Fibrobacterales bacterium]
MPQFCITYLGGEQPSSPEEGKKHMTQYMEWIRSLGSSAISPANPFKGTQTVHPDKTVTPGSTTSMSGFTIIEAESMDAALTIAQACPFLETNGTLEVSELMQMPGS